MLARVELGAKYEGSELQSSEHLYVMHALMVKQMITNMVTMMMMMRLRGSVSARLLCNLEAIVKWHLV